jgi:hypothetical protein
MCMGRVSSFCSTRGTRRVNLVTNPVISHGVVCPSSSYGFWLPHYYLQTRLIYTMQCTRPVTFLDWHRHLKKWDRVTRTSLKTGGELMCMRRVFSFCSTSGTRRVNLVTNLVISHEWGTYPWSFVTQILRDDFNFPIVNFPFISSSITAAYGEYVSQLIWYSRACGSY